MGKCEPLYFKPDHASTLCPDVVFYSNLYRHVRFKSKPQTRPLHPPHSKYPSGLHANPWLVTLWKEVRERRVYLSTLTRTVQHKLNLIAFAIFLSSLVSLLFLPLSGESSLATTTSSKCFEVSL